MDSIGDLEQDNIETGKRLRQVENEIEDDQEKMEEMKKEYEKIDAEESEDRRNLTTLQRVLNEPFLEFKRVIELIRELGLEANQQANVILYKNKLKQLCDMLQ